MKFKQVILILVSISFFAFGLQYKLKKKVRKEIVNTFKIEKFDIEPVVISNEVIKSLPSDFSKNNLMKIKVVDSLLGYFYTSKAPSKADDFDYMVLLDSELIVLKAKILVYREDYGGEIGSRRWLKQFIGKTHHDDLKYGDNIMAISGATISVRSMTNAMNNVLKSIKILSTKNII